MSLQKQKGAGADDSLWAHPADEDGPACSGPIPANYQETSKAAERAIRPHKHTLQNQCLEALDKFGSNGASNEDISEAADIKLCTVTPRMNELARMEKVVLLQRVKNGPAGTEVQLWCTPRWVGEQKTRTLRERKNYGRALGEAVKLLKANGIEFDPTPFY